MRYNDIITRAEAINSKIREQYGELFDADQAEVSLIDASADWWANRIATQYAEELGEAEKCMELVERYKKRAEAFKARADYRKQSLLVLAQISGKAMRTAAATVSLGKGQPSVVIKGDVPEYYKIAQEPKIDMARIKDELKAGKELDWAELAEPREHVVIRMIS